MRVLSVGLTDSSEVRVLPKQLARGNVHHTSYNGKEHLGHVENDGDFVTCEVEGKARDTEHKLLLVPLKAH